MSDELLRHPVHSGHLLVGALKRHKDKPVLFLGGTTLSGGEMADRISQYIQAFEALGAGTGATAGLLSLNRPEVLMITGAGQTQGYRRMSLHPLGSLDDHAYVLSDGGWWDVCKCQSCLASVSRERAPMFGSYTPLGLTVKA